MLLCQVKINRFICVTMGDINKVWCLQHAMHWWNSALLNLQGHCLAPTSSSRSAMCLVLGL